MVDNNNYILCCTDNVMLFPVTGVFLTLLGLVLGILYFSLRSITDSIEHTESAIPTYVVASALIVSGMLVLILFRKRNRPLIAVSLLLTVVCISLCLSSAALLAVQVIPFLESFTHCVSRKTLKECQCYVIENHTPHQNSSSSILDAGGSEQVTFHGTLQCSLISTAILDITYTQCVVYAIGTLSSLMAMVFTILLLCSEHQATKHYVHHEIDALSDDPSVTSSAIGRTFSRRILIPGNHSYTLGRRQGHNFLRPPYASYLRERDNTCLLSSDIEHENHSNLLPQYESVVMTTMQRSNGRSEASGSNETSRRENISMAQPQLTQNSTSVESEETATPNRESRTRSAVTRPHSQVFERRVHPIQDDNADRVNFSTLVGLQQPRNERRNVRRSASNSVVDDVRRQRRPRSRNRISEPNPLQERFVPAYDGSMLPVYTVPGSDEVFVNMRDIYAFQMPLSYPYEPAPSYLITAPSYVEEPPPYSPTEDTTGGLWSTQTFPGYHGNRCGRNSSTNSAFPLLDGLQCATLRTNQSENATETVRLNNLSRTPRHIACPRQPITRNIVDQSSPTIRRDSAELLEQRNNATENTESNGRSNIPVTVIDPIQ